MSCNVQWDKVFERHKQERLAQMEACGCEQCLIEIKAIRQMDRVMLVNEQNRRKPS